jgi:hypothetical protein
MPNYFGVAGEIQIEVFGVFFFSTGDDLKMVRRRASRVTVAAALATEKVT